MPKNHAKKIWSGFILKKLLIYTIGALSLLLANIMQILTVRSIGWIIDFFSSLGIPAVFMSSTPEQTFFRLFAFYFACLLIMIVGRFGWRITFGRQTHRSSSFLKKEIWEHVRFFKKQDLKQIYSRGMLMNASTSDVASAKFIFGFTLVGLLDAIFLGISTFIAMALIDFWLAALSMSSLFFVPVIVRKLCDEEVERYKIAQEDLSKFNDLSTQMVGTIKLQRFTQTGKFWYKKLMGAANHYRLKRLAATYTSLKYIPTMGGATLVSYIVLFAVGIFKVFQGTMSVGDFVAMLGLVFVLQEPLFGLGFIISELQKGMTSLVRLSTIFREKKDESLLPKGEKQGGAFEKSDQLTEVVKANDLSFQFPDGDKPVFSNISISLRKGDRLGIQGPVGSGKTTLLSVLSGLERDHGGSLNFYGRTYETYSHQELRKNISMVPQKAFLFADSIRQNILMNVKAKDDQIWHYLSLSGIADDVRRLPHQLDTQLGEWGINLSGGQKQRLTLCRALIRKPELLFLDDCLSAVDTLTEEKVLRNLDRELRETTLVWVAHRKSTLKYCNLFLQL